MVLVLDRPLRMLVDPVAAGRSGNGLGLATPVTSFLLLVQLPLPFVVLVKGLAFRSVDY